MASIVEQQQDLFFEFDFEQPVAEAEGIIDIAKCKRIFSLSDVFAMIKNIRLIGFLKIRQMEIVVNIM